MKLYLMLLGTLTPHGIPVPGYVVQTDDGTNILIDSGFPQSFITHPPDPALLGGLGVNVRPEDSVVSRLAGIGLAPGDINILIATHFDPDHAGSHDLFANAEMVVQRSHYEVARAGHARAAIIRAHWDRPAERIRLVDGDTTLLPGIDLIETSGHVVGHQAVLVRLPDTGPVLLAIDAVPAASFSDPDTRAMLPVDEDEAVVRASTRKLADIAKREGVTLTVYGHDTAQWPTLRHAPAFYS